MGTNEPAAGLASPRVMVLVPAFNEAGNLPSLIRELRTVCPHYDILVVDDCSTDDTPEVVAQLPVRLIRLPYNLGIGGAVQTGLKRAFEKSYDIVVRVDGDGQHPPSEIPKLVKTLGESGCDVVIGSRFLLPGGYQSTRGRRAGIKVLSLLLSLLCGSRLTDPTSGFQALNRRAIGRLAARCSEDYPEVEAILFLSRAGLRITEIPVAMSDRRAGHSSIRFFHAVSYMIKVPLALLMDIIRRPQHTF